MLITCRLGPFSLLMTNWHRLTNALFWIPITIRLNALSCQEVYGCSCEAIYSGKTGGLIKTSLLKYKRPLRSGLDSKFVVAEQQ